MSHSIGMSIIEMITATPASELRRVLVPLLPFVERNKSNCLASNGKVADNLKKAGWSWGYVSAKLAPLRSRLWWWLGESREVFAVRFWRHPRRTQSVVENVGVTFTPRSVVDDRWQEGFSSLVHTFFAISAAFFFWKE